MILCSHQFKTLIISKDKKADVILKCNANEARSLKAYGELPEHAKINETDTFGPREDDEIQFDDVGDDDEDIDDVSIMTLTDVLCMFFMDYVSYLGESPLLTLIFSFGFIMLNT
uniref:Uncharacterized protein n=1 Tax=Castor canadensis TaxID=51338 RepID=A0A8C0WUL6_CASCN